MNKETLKELIEIEFDRCETISHFKKEVFRLIDLYDNDNQKISKPFPQYPLPPPQDRKYYEGEIPPNPYKINYEKKK